MKIDKEQNIMFFDNDDEFYEFCVIPKIIPVPFTDPVSKETLYKMDFKLSDSYEKAKNNDTVFVICDDNSQIYKHGCVSYRTISKKIDNLEPYYYYN